MLEINDFDRSRPEDARTPDNVQARGPEMPVPGELLGHLDGEELAQLIRLLELARMRCGDI